MLAIFCFFGSVRVGCESDFEVNGWIAGGDEVGLIRLKFY